jgi:ParB-like chromosome segregation protein Spo0J
MDQTFVESQDVLELKAHPRNPRRGDVDKIRESIRRNGFYGTVVAQRSTGYILAGNHRVEAARQEGYTHVPVMWVDCDDRTAARILLVDNRASDTAFYDDTELLGLLREFDMGDLEGTGWTDYDLTELEKVVESLEAIQEATTDAFADPAPEMEAEILAEYEDTPAAKPDKFSVCPNCGHTWDS